MNTYRVTINPEDGLLFTTRVRADNETDVVTICARRYNELYGDHWTIEQIRQIATPDPIAEAEFQQAADEFLTICESNPQTVGLIPEFYQSRQR